MLCGSYFEMIEKLGNSGVQGLTTVDDFNKEMAVYNQIKSKEFCDQFLSYVPNDQKTYPNSYALRNRLPDKCDELCFGTDDNLAEYSKRICEAFAIGFKLSTMSNVEVQSVQESNPVTNSTNNLSAEGSRSMGSAPADTSQKLDSSSNVKLEKDKVSVDVPINGNGTDADAATKPKKVDVVTTSNVQINEADKKADEKSGADIFDPNSGSAAEAPKVEVSDTKTDEPSPVKVNEKQNVKPAVNSSENSTTQKTPSIPEYQIGTEENFEDPDVSEESEPEDVPDEPFKSAPVQSQLPREQSSQSQEDPFTDDTDSNFFTYFMFLLLVCVIAYVVYHNKSKMLALMLEGRRSNTNGRGGLSRRKHTAAYRKLDSNLEEAITSSGNGRSTQVIY